MSTKEEKLTREHLFYKRYSYRFSWLHLMRPMTFTGTISPILAGTGLAALKGPIRLDTFIPYFVAALIVQSTVNLLNDFYDFQKGQDQEKWLEIEEHVSWRVPEHHRIPMVAGCMIFAAIIIGLWLTAQSSYWVAVIGTLGIIFGYGYSAGPKPFSSIGLGELVAAIFLGFVPTLLAYIVQGHTLDLQILAISIPYALLITSMILSNNIRDIEKDKAFRQTLAIKLGRTKASYMLTTLLISVYLWVIVLIAFHFVSWPSIIVIFALPMAIRLWWSFRNKASRKDEISGMKWAALHHWAFGLLFALGIWLSSVL